MNNHFSKILGEKRIKISDVHYGTNISRSILSELYFERGNPTVETLRKICDYLKVPLSELIEYVPEESEE